MPTLKKTQHVKQITLKNNLNILSNNWKKFMNIQTTALGTKATI
jgi:hypothetical protein